MVSRLMVLFIVLKFLIAFIYSVIWIIPASSCSLRAFTSWREVLSCVSVLMEISLSVFSSLLSCCNLSKILFLITVLIGFPAVLLKFKFLFFDILLLSVIDRNIETNSCTVSEMFVEIPWIACQKSGIGKPVYFWVYI